MEKDYFKDRHPNCTSLKAVQEHLSIENGDVFICEKAMQTVATELSDLTRVTILAILSNGDHPRGLKIKGVDKYGHIKIGRITYFIYNECILTTKGLIPINKILYKNHYFFHLYFEIEHIKNVKISFRLPDCFFINKEDFQKKIDEFSIYSAKLYPSYFLFKTKKNTYQLKDNLYFWQDENVKKQTNIEIFKKLQELEKKDIYELKLHKIQLKQVT